MSKLKLLDDRIDAWNRLGKRVRDRLVPTEYVDANAIEMPTEFSTPMPLAIVPEHVAPAPAIVADPGIDVEHGGFSTFKVQPVFLVRCGCGARWFEPDALPRIAQCKKCRDWGLTSKE